MRLAPLVITAMLLAASPAAAQADIYAQTVNWQIEREGAACILRNRAAAGEPELTLRQSSGGDIDLAIVLPAAIELREERSSLRMEMNSYSENLGLTDRGTRLQVLGLGQDFAAAFIRSYTLDVVGNAGPVTSFDLAGTSVAFGFFDHCVRGTPARPVLPAPPLRPPIPEPDLAAPLPPSRPVAPIRPGAWITGYDVPAHPSEGRVNFRVTVTPQGRATDCEVTASTAEARLGELTCQLVTRRARFDPATDAAGNPVSASWESAVVWRLAD